jgi:hypothetical protein
VHQLSWKMETPVFRPQSDYCSPSWSWASVDRKFDMAFWGSSDMSVCTHIVNAETMPKGEDSFVSTLTDGFEISERAILSIKIHLT